MHQDDIVIVGYKRTAMGSFQGAFASFSAAQLGAAAIKGAVEASNTLNLIDGVIMGCVLTAGQGQAPARQAAILAGISNKVPCSTINRMCGSGMQAIIQAVNALKAGHYKLVVAGGMESMTNAPYLLEKARSGYRMGHGQIKDHMFLDGLEDAYDKGKLMGVFAERTAEKYSFTRQMQDEFAIQSITKAQQAIANNKLSAEITAFNGVTIDEAPGKAKLEKIPTLKPAFKDQGTVTAANASSISDGAAALILTTASYAAAHKLKVIARIKSVGEFAHEPEWFTTAPIGAIKQALARAELKIQDINLFEINEAFAVVTMAASTELKLDASKVNVHGGACALGHPIGASGARIVCTLLNALEQYNLRLGLGALCIGGGEGVALIVERN